MSKKISLAEWLIQVKKEKEESRNLYIPKHINASSIYKCPREIYYRMTSVIPQYKETNWFTLDIGNSLHTMFQKLNKTSKLSEVKFLNEEYNLCCKPDDVIDLEDQLLLAEFKVISPRGFWNLREPKPEHYWQFQSTLFVTGIPQGSILYFCPDTSLKDEKKFKEYFFEQDSEAIEKIKQKCRMIQEALKIKKVPVCDTTKCKWCLFKHRCKEDGR